MIKAVFYKKNGAFTGFSISGHADYADEGQDVVCASVSSAGMFAANTVTDFLKADADVSAENNLLELMLKNHCESAEKLIESLHTHIGFISQDYKGTIRISVLEV